MATADIAIRIVTKGAQLAEKQLKGVGDSSGKSGGKLAKFGKAAKVAGLAVAVGLAKALSESVEAFMEFDDKMTQSLAIMDTTVDQQKAMADAAVEMSRTTLITASQSAEAYFFLASAGLDAEQSIAALPQVAAFAQAGMFDMATATDLATDAQSALGLTVNDAGKNLENLTRVTDVLVRGNQLANASVQQFSEALTNKAGAALKVVNKDIEEGMAVLAAFADRGVKGAEAGDKLNQVLRDIPRATAKNGEEFKKLGLNMFDTEGNMKNVADIVEELDAVLGPMSDEMKAATLDQLGLNRGVADAVKILSGAGDQIREYEKQLRNAGGATEQVAENQMDSLKSQTQLMKNAFAELGIGIGSILAGPLTSLVKWITKTTQKVADMVNVFIEWKDAVKESNAEIQKNIHGVNYSAEAFRNYEKAVDGVNEVVQDEIDLIHEQNALLTEQNKSRGRNRDMLDRIRNTYTDTSATVDEYVEQIEELKEEEDELAKQREAESLPALNKVLSAYKNIQDIHENIADLQKDEKKALEKLTKEKGDLDKANKAVIKAEEELERQKLRSKEVTLQEELAIIRANEALEKAQENLDNTRRSEVEYELAKANLEETIRKSTSATSEEESALRELERAEQTVIKETEDLTKAQDAYREAQEELAEATAQSTENIMEMAIAKMELDSAIADIEALDGFETALAQMVANAGGDLDYLREQFQAIFNLTGTSLTTGAPSMPPDVEEVVEKAAGTGSGSGSDSFSPWGQKGNVAIINWEQKFEGAVNSKTEFDDAVAMAIKKLQRDGVTVAL